MKVPEPSLEPNEKDWDDIYDELERREREADLFVKSLFELGVKLMEVQRG